MPALEIQKFLDGVGKRADHIVAESVLQSIRDSSIQARARVEFAIDDALYRLATRVIISKCMDGRQMVPCGRSHASMGAISTVTDADPIMNDVISNMVKGYKSTVLLSWHSGCAAFHNDDKAAKHSASLALCKWRSIFASTNMVKAVMVGYDMSNHCMVFHADKGDFFVCQHRNSSLETIKSSLKVLFQDFDDDYLSDLATIAWLNAHNVNQMEERGCLGDASVHRESAIILGDYRALGALDSNIALKITVPALDLKAQEKTALTVVKNGIEKQIIPSTVVLLGCSYFDPSQNTRLEGMSLLSKRRAELAAQEYVASMLYLIRRLEGFRHLAPFVVPCVGTVDGDGVLTLGDDLSMVAGDMQRLAARGNGASSSE